MTCSATNYSTLSFETFSFLRDRISFFRSRSHRASCLNAAMGKATPVALIALQWLIWCVADAMGPYGAVIYLENNDGCYGRGWHVAKRGDAVCMDELGCFNLTDDFYDEKFRPCNVLPDPRAHIHTRFILFTKSNTKQGKFLVANNETSLTESGLDANLPTKFIVHGFHESPLRDHWVLAMMEEILRDADANVIIVDWSGGSYASYLQAVANTRVVGAEIALLADALQQSLNIEPRNIHVIGHGLGAHAAGYAGQRMTTKPSRITGLAPAYKFFCNMPDSVRLDITDADFVDLIHTNSDSYKSGDGLCNTFGHVDFIPNGGRGHPECHHSPWSTSSGAFFAGFKGVSLCGSNQQSVALFINSIGSSKCQMTGFWCSSYKAFLRGECTDCGDGGGRCAVMGYKADDYASRRSANHSTMYLITAKNSPFCLFQYRLRLLLNSTEAKKGYNSQTGSLLVALKGEQKPLFVHLSFYSHHEGNEYTFLVTTPADIGEIKNITVKWEEFGSFIENWHSGHEAWHFRSANAQVDDIYVTLMNSVGSGDGTRSPPEVRFCKSETTDRKSPRWTTYLPGC